MSLSQLLTHDNSAWHMSRPRELRVCMRAGGRGKTQTHACMHARKNGQANFDEGPAHSCGGLCGGCWRLYQSIKSCVLRACLLSSTGDGGSAARCQDLLLIYPGCPFPAGLHLGESCSPLSFFLPWSSLLFRHLRSSRPSVRPSNCRVADY